MFGRQNRKDKAMVGSVAAFWDSLSISHLISSSSSHGTTIFLSKFGQALGIERQSRGNRLYQVSRWLSIILHVLHQSHQAFGIAR